jgi:ATP-binding cassette, subfamily B, bacterial
MSVAGINNIFNYYRPYWSLAILSIGASSLLELTDLFTPYAMGQILNLLSQEPIDRPVQIIVNLTAQFTGLSEGPYLVAGLLTTLLFLFTVGRAPIQPWIGQWRHWNISFQARRDHYSKIHEKLFTLPIDFYDENNAGRLSSCISRGIDNHTWVYNELAGVFIPKCLRVFGIFLMILFLEWRIALAFGFSFVFILGLNQRIARELTRGEKLVYTYAESTDSRTSELIASMKTVKAFAAEARELKRQQLRFEREFKVLKDKVTRGYVRLNVRRNSIVQLFMFTILVTTLIATMRKEISLGHFVTILTLSTMAFSDIEPIGDLAEYFARRYASMVRFHELLQQPSGLDAATLDLQQSNPYKFIGKLEFRNLSFGYAPERLVLKNINLLIQPRQTIAIVGHSGAGKSTLAKLIFRYVDPNHGQILVDDNDVRSLDITCYRKCLAIVHQEVDIFNSSLLENLTYGRPNATPAEIKEACRIACFDQTISDLPHGYQTVVGERGIRLSGGQRQRLGIARALICDPAVLVFDEATSSLDYESERAIQIAMRSILGTRTVIIIAHRLSTVREADLIVVLDRGIIVETGKHEELLKHGGKYHRLFTLQETGRVQN